MTPLDPVEEYKMLKQQESKLAEGLKSKLEHQLAYAVETLTILKQIAGDNVLTEPRFAHHTEHLLVGFSGQPKPKRNQSSKSYSYALTEVIIGIVREGPKTQRQITTHPCFTKFYTDMGQKPSPQQLGKLKAMVENGKLTCRIEQGQKVYALPLQ